MTIFERLKSVLQGKKDAPVPDGYCPNCWGEQQYEGRFLEKLQAEKIDMNNIDQKRGWVQGIAAQYVSGIKQKETDDLFECPNCKLRVPKK